MFVIVLPANQLPQEYSCLRIQSLKSLVRIFGEIEPTLGFYLDTLDP
jgi:hypothetical protein